MYPLPLSNARTVNDLRIENYRVLVLTDCQSRGFIQYAHVALVYPLNHNSPVYAVAAEANRMADVFGGGSHFLCVYENSHSNYGSADDWADLGTFTEEALYLISARFVGMRDDVPQTPEARLLQRRMTRYQDALKTLDPNKDAESYAQTQLKLGETYAKLAGETAESNNYVSQSIAAYQAALPFLSPDMQPEAYIDTLTKLATNHLHLASSRLQADGWSKARDVYQSTISSLTTSAMTAYLQSKKNYVVARLYDELGIVYKWLGDMPAAIRQWQLAEQVYRAFGRDKIAEFMAEKIAKAQTNT